MIICVFLVGFVEMFFLVCLGGIEGMLVVGSVGLLVFLLGSGVGGCFLYVFLFGIWCGGGGVGIDIFLLLDIK